MRSDGANGEPLPLNLPPPGLHPRDLCRELTLFERVRKLPRHERPMPIPQSLTRSSVLKESSVEEVATAKSFVVLNCGMQLCQAVRTAFVPPTGKMHTEPPFRLCQDDDDNAEHPMFMVWLEQWKFPPREETLAEARRLRAAAIAKASSQADAGSS
jgi:hypothetical protein